MTMKSAIGGAGATVVVGVAAFFAISAANADDTIAPPSSSIESPAPVDETPTPTPEPVVTPSATPTPEPAATPAQEAPVSQPAPDPAPAPAPAPQPEPIPTIGAPNPNEPVTVLPGTDPNSVTGPARPPADQG